MRSVLFLFLSVLLTGGEVAIQPTADEQRLLDLINLHRTNRQLGDVMVADMVNKGMTVATPHEWSWAAATYGIPGMGEPLPPVVFNPALIAAARALLASGIKAPDGQLFDALPALRRASYGSPNKGLAMFGLDSPSMIAAYARAVLNRLGTRTHADSTYPYFPVRDALQAEWREAGVAVARVKAGFSLVIVLGTGSATRYVGGLVFADANRSLAYDQGEGKAGVTVTCGNVSTTTGPAGSWWLALPADAPTEIVYASNGYTTVRQLGPGTANSTCVWRFPNATDGERADRLIAAIDQAGKNAEKMRAAQVALLIGTRMSALDDGRQARIDALVAPIREEVSQTTATVMAMLGEEPATFKKTLARQQEFWNGAMPAWFKEAGNLPMLRQQVGKVLAAPASQRAMCAPAVIALVDKAMATTVDPIFLGQYKTWKTAMEETISAAPQSSSATLP